LQCLLAIVRLAIGEYQHFRLHFGWISVTLKTNASLQPSHFLKFLRWHILLRIIFKFPNLLIKPKVSFLLNLKQ
jgi:hypothetical protein